MRLQLALQDWEQTLETAQRFAHLLHLFTFHKEMSSDQYLIKCLSGHLKESVSYKTLDQDENEERHNIESIFVRLRHART